MVCMKVIKKNQIIVFVFAFMLVAAGYLNYTKNSTASLKTAGLIDSEEIAGIGDAKLVNSNNVVKEGVDNTNKSNTENVVTPSTEKSNKINSSEAENNSTNTTNNKDTISTASVATSDYFINSKLERDKMYSQMLETYQRIIESTSVSEEQKTISQAEVTKIQSIKNGIMIAENLIKNKGFKDVIIFVNDYSISVIVDCQKLEEAEIAQIQNIVVREFNANVEDIHVSCINNNKK